MTRALQSGPFQNPGGGGIVSVTHTHTRKRTESLMSYIGFLLFPDQQMKKRWTCRSFVRREMTTWRNIFLTCITNQWHTQLSSAHLQIYTHTLIPLRIHRHLDTFTHTPPLWHHIWILPLNSLQVLFDRFLRWWDRLSHPKTV